MDAEQRVSTAERQAAMEALGVHARAGRISAAEYEDRSQAAKNAVTWQHLRDLFSDLPEPHPVQVAEAPAQAGRATPAPVAASAPAPVPAPVPASADVQAGPNLIPAPYGTWLVSLSPFIALGLFLAFQQWWIWLLIPVAGLIVYGPHEQRDRDRKRDR